MTGERTWHQKAPGREYGHVCVDDATRLAYVEVLAGEKAKTSIGLLRRALAFYAAHGIAVERLMTDNGGACVSTAHAIALDFYNWRRPHGALPHKPPGTRLAELKNVADSYS